MGFAFNPDVDVFFSQTDEQDVVRTLRPPFDGDLTCFVLANVENKSDECRLSYVVIGPSPESVQEFLIEKTGRAIAEGPVKHALKDLATGFQLAQSVRHLNQAFGPEAFKRPGLRAIDTLIPTGCCSESGGVSVLIVNKPESREGRAAEYRQVLLTNKHITCEIAADGSMKQLTVKDVLATDACAAYAPCKE